MAVRRMLRTYRHPSLLKWTLRAVGAEAEVEVGLGWPLALAFGVWVCVCGEGEGSGEEALRAR